MIWLAAQMWILLLAAFAIGVAVGWWAWGLAKRNRNASAYGSLQSDSASSEPALYASPQNGEKDDLTQIIGLDEKTEARLNKIGVYHLRQIAAWTPKNVRWIEKKLGEQGRIEREHWIEQATTALG